jgi:hypothetical protein
VAVKPLLLFPLFCLALLQQGRAEDLKIGTQMVYSRPSVTFDTRSDARDPRDVISLAPDARVRPGVEVRYRNYGFSFSSSLAEASAGAPRLVSGGLTDARTFYYGDAWGFEGYHRYARGFHSESDKHGVSEVYHPDMTLRSTSLTLYRALDDDFHVYRLSDGLPESGVEPDLMLVFNVSQNRLHDGMAFMYGSGVGGSRFEGLQDLNLYGASAGMGLVLSSNAGGVYFDPALFLGYGVQYREWNGRPETTFNLLKVNLRMRLGYRNRWFDAGGGFENDGNAAFVGKESVTFNALVARAQIQLYL